MLSSGRTELATAALFFLEIQNRTGIRQPNAPALQGVLVGQDRVGPSIKIIKLKFWQAGAIVVSAGQTAVGSAKYGLSYFACK